MKIQGMSYHTIWLKQNNPKIIQIIDQRMLPHRLVIEDLATVAQVARAIREMHLRGAPLIGAASAYGMYLACMEAPSGFLFDDYIKQSRDIYKEKMTDFVHSFIPVPYFRLKRFANFAH